MKVHFGGSLPGLKKHPENYKEIRKQIISLGNTLTRDWVLDELKGSKTVSEKDMYELTVKAIKKTDVVILESSHDISAVGQQMLLALDNNLPVLLLVPDDVDKENSFVGNFTSSDQQRFIRKERYNLKNLNDILAKFFEWADGNLKFARFNLVIEKKLDNYLKDKAKTNNSSKTEEIKKLISQDMARN